MKIKALSQILRKCVESQFYLRLRAPYFYPTTSCLDYYRVLSRSGEDEFSAKLQAEYDKRFPGKVLFTAGSGATGMYRGLKLWEAAVNEAGTTAREDVAKALDHAKIDQGPGGPAEMVPGKRHCRMNMYIAIAKNGQYELISHSKGLVDPKEC